MNVNEKIQLALEYQKAGNQLQAAKICREILKIQPDNIINLLILGTIHAQLKEFETAIDFFTKAIKINPNLTEAHYALGNALRDKGQIDEAISSFLKVIQLDQNYMEAYINLGFIYYESGRLEEAITYYQKAIQINPNFATVYYMLANALRNKEQYDESVGYYQKAQYLNPNQPEFQAAIELVLQEKEHSKKPFETINWIKLIDKRIKIESRCHPHCNEEKAYLFHAFDGGGTEIETLNMLRSIVLLFKSELIFETGTWLADGAIALGTALKENGFGKLISVETDSSLVDKAKMRVKQLGLSTYVEIINQNSLEFIENLDTTRYKFDLAFFDSDVSIRPAEFQKLYDKGALTDIIAFHDTSRLREKTYIEKDAPQDEYIRKLNEIEQRYCRGGIELPLSKGLRIMQLRKDINPAFIRDLKFKKR